MQDNRRKLLLEIRGQYKYVAGQTEKHEFTADRTLPLADYIDVLSGKSYTTVLSAR